jgi:endoglucanase
MLISRRKLLASVSSFAASSAIARDSAFCSPGTAAFVAAGQTLRCAGVTGLFEFANPDPKDPNRYAKDPWAGGRNWTDDMPERLLNAIVVAGFDGLRLAIDPGPMLADTDEARLNYLTSQIISAVDIFTSRQLKCVVDMHISGTPSSVSGWGIEDLIDGISGSKFQRLVAVEQHLAGVLNERYHSSDVAFELFNEPPPPVKFLEKTAWSVQLKYLFDAVRSDAPELTLIVTGNDFGSPKALIRLEPSQFDTNTMFSFHCYDPMEFTFQSIPQMEDLSYIHRLAFPPNPLNQVADISAAKAAISSDSSLSWIDRIRLENQVTRRLSDYFNTPHDATWIGTIHKPVSTWADNHGVARNRVILGEFGAWGDTGASLGADLASRANYLRASRENAEALGFNWSVWDLDNKGASWRLIDGSQMPIHELIAALGLKTSD